MLRSATVAVSVPASRSPPSPEKTGSRLQLRQVVVGFLSQEPAHFDHCAQI